MEHFKRLTDLIVLLRKRSVTRKNSIVDILQEKHFIKGVRLDLLQHVLNLFLRDIAV